MTAEHVIPNFEPDVPPIEFGAPRNGKRRPQFVDVGAEESLLGACLLSPTAVDAAIAVGVTGSSFVGTGGAGLIWDAITTVHEQGGTPDAVTVATELARSGWLTSIGYGTPGTDPAEYLVELTSRCPAISNADNYARIVVEQQRQRHVVSELERCLTTANHGQWRTIVDNLTATADGWNATGKDAALYIELDDFLNVDDDADAYDWVIPGLLERGDRTIITAGAGHGKSTLLRQLGLMASGGLHPFTQEDIAPCRVLLLDVENSERQIRRAVRPLREQLGCRYSEARFTVRVFGEPIHVADPKTLAEITHAIEDHEPDIILAGPIYKLIHGKPIDEEPAREVAEAFDHIRHTYGSALIIEAHTPYAANGRSKRETRPYGASLWERWPEFGWHFDEQGTVTHWRGMREQRAWPTALQRDAEPWPWAVRAVERIEVEEWHGPTRCIQAIVDLLRDTGEELSGNQLFERLRAVNPGQQGFRQKTVRDGAETAAASPEWPVSVRSGAHRSRLFSYAEDAESEAGSLLDEPF